MTLLYRRVLQACHSSALAASASCSLDIATLGALSQLKLVLWIFLFFILPSFPSSIILIIPPSLARSTYTKMVASKTAGARTLPEGHFLFTS